MVKSANSFNLDKIIDGAVLHFAHTVHDYRTKPWIYGNQFYNEWKRNLERAERIDLSARPDPVKKWSRYNTAIYYSYLRLSQILKKAIDTTSRIRE